MVGSSRVFHLTRYLVASFLVLYFVFPYLRSHSPDYVRDHYDDILRSFQDEKKLFVADFLENEVGGEIDGSALSNLCASKTWIPASQPVIVSCEPVPGGIGEVKNGQLNCIRFAIEIGAQLILPRMHQRSPADISNLHGGKSSKGLSLDYMFSKTHLVSSLQRYCPQLQVHDSLDALYDRPSLLKPLSLALTHLTADFATVDETPTNIVQYPDYLSGQFAVLMDRELPVEKRYYPVRADLANTFFAWPVFNETSGATFRADFGKLLRVRDDIRALAASALWNLANTHAVTLPNPQKAAGNGLVAAATTTDEGGGFIGVHLRTEKDAVDSGFPPYGDQAPYFLDFLQNQTTPLLLLPPAGQKRIVFLATGLTARDEDVKRFRARAAELNATVVVKRDLLDADEISVLNGLTWDQRALLDYEILLHAGTFLGVVESSFSWGVALRRSLAYGTGDTEGFLARPGGAAFEAGVFERSEIVMWQDRWSRLFGRTDRAVGMYYAAWP